MGADVSKASGSPRSSASSAGGVFKNLSQGSRAGIVARWQKRHHETQLFGVVRHAERADGVYAFVGNGRWTMSEDYKQWPLDPPLSDAGLEHARDIGETIDHFAMDNNSAIHVVITSPYLRCVQTAVLISKQLGPGVRLLVDQSLGEVYGPSVMGSTQPQRVVRDMEQTMAICRENGVNCQARVIGQWPIWPEALQAARVRYALRFLFYLQRSVTTRRNFVLVAHADCVGAVLPTMPSMMDKVVTGVEYGALFLARRKRKAERKMEPATAEGRGHFVPLLPTACEGDQGASPTIDELAVIESELEAESERPDVLSPTLQGNWMQDQSSEVPSSHSLKQSNACDGWQVDLHSITIRKREGAGKFKKRIKALAKHGDFTQERITQLLGDMGDKSLAADLTGLSADNELELNSAQTLRRPSNTGRSNTVANSCCSLSTYLFGASDVGSLRDLENISDRHQSDEDQPGSSEEAARESRRSVLWRRSERMFSDSPIEVKTGLQRDISGSSVEENRRLSQYSDEVSSNGEITRKSARTESSCASNRSSASFGSSLRPRLSSLRSYKHRKSLTECQSGQPLTPRTALLEKVCEKMALEREGDEEQLMPEKPPKAVTNVARETGAHLKASVCLQVPQNRTKGDRHSHEHVVGIPGVTNVSKDFQQPPHAIRKKQQSELLSRRGCKAPPSLQIDRSGGDRTIVPNTAREVKPSVHSGSTTPAEERGTPPMSVLTPDEGLVASTPTAPASQPAALSVTLPTIVAKGMGSSAASAATGTQMPALRDLRSSSLMRRRGTKGSAAATQLARGVSDQTQGDVVPAQQQDQPAAQMEKAAPATDSAKAVNAAATPRQQTSLGGRLQPCPPPEDAQRPAKPRPRRRVWNTLA